MQASRLVSLVFLFAAPTLAQTNGTYLIDVSGVASPSNPTVHVEIWAAWDDPNTGFVFWGGNYDLVADDGLFSNAVVNPNLNLSGPGGPNTPGIALGNRVIGASIGQLHGIVGIFGIADNPIWLASYDWTATDFTPRGVGLITTVTDVFWVADIVTGATTQLFPGQFTPGSGIIQVVPAPGAFPLFGLALFAYRRRRSAGSA